MQARWRRLSTTQLRELWTRWKDGQTLEEIGRALERPHASVYNVLRRHGGIAPRARTRAAHTLCLAEREEISRGLIAGMSVRVMARQLGRAPSTISREIVGMGELTRIARPWQSRRRLRQGTRVRGSCFDPRTPRPRQ